MISVAHLRDVCLVNNMVGGKCRYLGQIRGTDKKVCLKLSKRQYKRINEATAFLLEDEKKNGKSVNISLGDGCGGYVILRYYMQGYDQ